MIHFMSEALASDILRSYFTLYLGYNLKSKDKI